MIYCPETGKVSYSTRSDARTALRKIRNRIRRSTAKRPRKYFEQKVYQCHHCGEWHLSTSPETRL